MSANSANIRLLLFNYKYYILGCIRLVSWHLANNSFAVEKSIWHLLHLNQHQIRNIWICTNLI